MFGKDKTTEHNVNPTEQNDTSTEHKDKTTELT
jgi:hypothetical protein